MTRNVLNIRDVERFLDGLRYLDEDRAIEQWLDRVARRWILKEFPAAGRVVRARRFDGEETGVVDVRWAEGADSRGETSRESPIPDWLEGALHQGVHWLDMDGPSARELAAQLAAVLAYFRGLVGSTRLSRVGRISLPDAIALASRFRAMQASGTRASRAGGSDNTLMAFKNGFRIALLTTAKELTLEGERMRHCVGDYTEDLSEGLDILSLRDAADRPHVTMEVQGSRWVHQIKGKANGPVIPRYRPYVLAFFKAMDLHIKGDQELIGATHRSFEALAPEGWLNRPGLAQTIRSDIAGRTDDWEELGAFYGDVEAAIDRMPEEAWSWFVELFRGPTGALVWLEPIRRYEIAEERFFLAEIRFPFRLFWAVRRRRDQRSRWLKRRILDDLATVVVGFCYRDNATLMAPDGSENYLEIDVRRLRHEHMERLRRRLAGARRTMRRAAEGKRQPEAALAQWECDRRQLAYCLNEEPMNYL